MVPRCAHLGRALIADNAVAKVDRSGDSGFNEQLYSAVDGGVADLQVPGMQGKEKLININLAVEIDELLKNDIALLAGIYPSCGQVLSEDFFRISYHKNSPRVVLPQERPTVMTIIFNGVSISSQ